MRTTTMLWVDLRNQTDESCLAKSFDSVCHTQTIKGSSDIVKQLDALEAELICFEYDYPDIQSLNLLQQTRKANPELPILMFTEQHSEALAVWAFRTGVWDYHVKPLSDSDLSDIAGSLKTARCFRNSIKERMVASERVPIPDEARFRAPTAGEKALLPVISYIDSHYRGKIVEADMAKLCGLTVSKFSRLFKLTRGVTFQEYLIRYRLDESVRLLLNPAASIADVAFTIGFNDPSYYARAFKKYMGISPSQYRKTSKADKATENIESDILETSMAG